MQQTNGVSSDDGDFVRRTAPFRGELLAHCYRMSGSVDDAEDLVQETYLRAWRSFDTFEGRASVRTWLYRIATNVCLTALQHRSRRWLPSGLVPPTSDPMAPLDRTGPEVSWLQPLPDALMTLEANDPAAIVDSRETLRLALVAALQYLPGRQRAVLILRDVLAWTAPEVAETLGITTAAVKSILQRARTRLGEVAPAVDEVVEPDEPELRAVLDQYMLAFNNADAAALKALLREDATLEATPVRTWFSGLDTCMPFLAERILGRPGDWQMVASSANRQPAAVAYRRGPDGTHRAYGVIMLTASTTGIARIYSFGDPKLVQKCGFPEIYQPAPASH